MTYALEIITYIRTIIRLLLGTKNLKLAYAYDIRTICLSATQITTRNTNCYITCTNHRVCLGVCCVPDVQPTA